MQSLYDRALAFARGSHACQRRKFTDEPYIVHPVAVADLVREHGYDDEMVAAALLHDTIEDCPAIEAADLARKFGDRVAGLVLEVTKARPRVRARRADRVAAEHARLAQISPEGKTIKLADIIDNTATVAQRDPAFAAVYLAEKRDLLPVLRGGDPTLWARAAEICGLIADNP